MNTTEAFKVQEPDYALSPYTGMTRKHWIEAGKYLLKGLFDNLDSIDSPPLVPRTEKEVTYPHLNAPATQQEQERKAEIFEGLTRTLFIASVLIHEDPKMEIGGINLRDYYSLHILRAVTLKDSPEYVRTFEELKELWGKVDPTRPFQQTVETCALVIGLYACKQEIWGRYSKEDRDKIADFLKGFAYAATVPQNWRLFNMLDMAFLSMEGYEIDERIMREHAQAVLHYYAGDGWYRDGHSFDYYSCWAFNVYAPIWNMWYGYEKEPYIAEKFERASNKLMETYHDFFDEKGYTMMWGRSCIYRFAAVSAFDGNFFLKNPACDPGRARRIASGSLMQFLGRDDYLDSGVPVLGFYKKFMPLVQGYSCAESVYWAGKAFLCLHLPQDHPFWTAVESNGEWKSNDKKVRTTTLDGPALSFSNHDANGTTVLRTGKVVKGCGDIHGMWNYGKLSYNSRYPWESSPIDRITGEVSKDTESMQYVLYDKNTGKYSRANVNFWYGEKEGVLYRRQFFDYNLIDESFWLNAVNLADIPVSYGILRVDKLRLFRPCVEVTLGSYGFPDNNTVITKKEKKYEISSLKGEAKRALTAKAIILKGYDSQGNNKQLAMTVYAGFSGIDIVKSRGSNADSENSLIIRAFYEKKVLYNSAEDYLLISQVITRESHEDFTVDELFPVKNIVLLDTDLTGAYGDITIELAPDVSAREKYCINYEKLEGQLLL